MATAAKQLARAKRKVRVRGRVSGSAAKPRMTVFRSNRNLYVQFIDDISGNTIVSVSSAKTDAPNKGTAEKVGEAAARAAIEKGVTEVVFDRNGYLYHGRIKALADSARKHGLKF